MESASPLQLTSDLRVTAVYGVPVPSSSGIPLSTIIGFVQRIKVSGGCWYWRSDGPRNGYGGIYHGGRTIQSHRFSYLLFNGELPKDKEVHHKCEIKNCVNPAHLEALTHIEHFWATPNNPAHERRLDSRCVNGHDYADTAFIDRQGHRRCQVCHLASKRKAAEKEKAARIPFAQRTHCSRGHLWIAENWIINKNRHKQCRLCHEITHAALLDRIKYREHTPKPRKTACIRGHELTVENVFINTSGYRECVACRRERAKLNPPKPRPHKERTYRLAPKTHCPLGHEYTESNKYRNPKTGDISCLTCRQERNRLYVRKR